MKTLSSLLSVTLLCTLPAFGETSVLGAGDLEAREPYGLSPTETYILENKRELRKLQNLLYSLEGKMEEMDTSMSGFKSVIRGTGENRNRLESGLNDVNGKLELLGEHGQKLEERLDALEAENKALKASFQENAALQNANYEKISAALKEMSTLIDNINGSYVTKGELKKALSALASEIDSNRKALGIAKEKAVKKADFPSDAEMGKTGAETLFAQAREMMEKKLYQQAKHRLDYLATHSDYNKAEVMFQLGEVFYQNGKYDEAVAAFKSSAKIDDKASYMPILLFHTGVAFQNQDKDQEAARFYQLLIAQYPDSFVTDSARKRLRKVQ